MSGPFDESILASLRRIIRAIDKFSRQLMHQFKLTTPQLVCLRTISRFERITPGELAMSVFLSQATLSGVLDRLEERGLVMRKRDDQDKRRVWLELTDSGRKLVENAPSPLHDKFSRRFRKLPHEEQRRINEVLQRMAEMMESEDIDAPPTLSTGPAADETRKLLNLVTAKREKKKPQVHETVRKRKKFEAK